MQDIIERNVLNEPKEKVLAYAYFCTRNSKGNKAVSVAPASPGKHLAARLETPSDVHFLKK